MPTVQGTEDGKRIFSCVPWTLVFSASGFNPWRSDLSVCL